MENLCFTKCKVSHSQFDIEDLLAFLGGTVCKHIFTIAMHDSSQLQAFLSQETLAKTAGHSST